VLIPLRLNSVPFIWTLLFLSLALRALLVINGIGLRDPWTYRFFPTELAFFLAGALAQQLLLPLYQTLASRKLLKLSRIATAFIASYSFLYILMPGGGVVKSMLLFAIFIPLMPLTFVFQNHIKLDRRIGELSYPIYIGHILVISTLSTMARTFVDANPYLSSVLNVLFSILFAILLNYIIGKRFERLRSSIKGGATKAVYPA
jgi:peptidoglycan/LPS O-acetylase OafA/YrhL